MKESELYGALKTLGLSITKPEGVPTTFHITARRFPGRYQRVSIAEDGAVYWGGSDRQIRPVNGDPDSPEDVAQAILRVMMAAATEFRNST